MGFFESIKTPENDKRFLFRQEYLSSVKYSIQNFSRNLGAYYPNFFYIEGEEGTGKTWFLNQISTFCHNPLIAQGVVSARFESKDVILSEVMGVINFLVKIRNSLVEADSSLDKAFSKFDESYRAFINGTLTEDGGSSVPLMDNNKDDKQQSSRAALQDEDETPLKKVPEPVNNDASKLKTAMRAGDAKSRLASMRANAMGTPQKSNVVATKTLASKEPTPAPTPVQQTQQPVIPTTQPHAISSHKPVGASSNAYSSINSITEKELPRKKSGAADVKAIAKNITNALEGLKRGVVKQVDYKSILTRRFLQAFDLVCTHRKVVLIMDEFEKIQPVHNFFFNVLLKNIKNEFILVISSQLDMERELKEKFDSNLHYMYLGNFTYLNIEEYFKKFHVISEPGIIESVFTLSQGSPTAISLIGGSFQNFKGDVFKIMKFIGSHEVEDRNIRYINMITLDNLPPHDKKVVILLALIRVVNYDLIESISGVFNAKNLIQSLCEKYPFIEEKGLSDMLRRFTRTYAKHETTSLYEEIHRLALDYFKNKLEYEPENKEYIIDFLYYQFRINEEAAYTNLLSYISQYLSTDVNFCEEMIHGIATTGVSKEMRARIANIKESLPYVILKDHKRTLPLLEAISEMQRMNPEMNLIDSF